jgi:hypothetical protein
VYLEYVEKHPLFYDIALIFKTFLLHTFGLNMDFILRFSPKVCNSQFF